MMPSGPSRSEQAGNSTSRSYLTQVYVRVLAVATLLVVLSVLGIYGGFRRLSISEITERSESMLLLQEQVFASLHGWIVPSMLELLTDPVVNSAVYFDGLTVLNLTRAANRIQTVAVTNPLIHSIYLYNPTADIVLSTVNGVERDVFSDPGLETMILSAGPRARTELIPRRVRVAGADTESRLLTLLLYDQVYHPGPSSGCLVLNIDERMLRSSFFRERGSTDTHLMIVNRHGIALSHWKDESFGVQVVDGTEFEPILRKSGATIAERTSIQGEPTLVVVARDDSRRWTLLSQTNEDRLTAGLIEFRNIMLWVLIGTIASAIVVGYLAARQISLPVHRVSEHARALMAEAENTTQVLAPTEIEYVDIVLQRLGNRVTELSSTVKSGQDSRTHEVLRNLLEGYSLENDVPQPPEVLTRATCLRATVVRLDQYRALIEMVDGPTIRSMIASIANAASEVFDRSILTVDFGKDHLAVIHPFAVEPDATDIDELRARYRILIDRIRDNLGSTVTVGIGSIVDSPTMLSQSYERALDASDYRFRLGPGSVIMTGDTGTDMSEYRFPVEDARRLMEEIRLGHGESALGHAEEIVHVASRASYADFRYTVETLMRTIRREFAERDDLSPESAVVVRRLAEHVDALDTVDTVMEAFRVAIASLVRSQNTHRHRRNQALVERINAYIEEHLADPNLSADGIAEFVGMSTNYLRDIYRQIAGDSLSNVLVDLRLERVKHLLVSSDESVKSVASQAGFPSDTYFFTFFRRRTGMTPGAYRRSRRHEDRGPSRSSKNS